MTTHQDTTTAPESSRVPESRIRIGVQLWPGGAPSYRAWRDAVLQAEELCNPQRGARKFPFHGYG